MSRTIWKYQLEVTDWQSVKMPEASKVLSAQVQDGRICVWVEVTPGAPLEEYSFLIYGTGHTLDPLHGGDEFIDTVQIDGLVFHVFSRSPS